MVQSLLGEVFSGRVKAGDHLVTQDLAERYQVSHTPIREALISLAGMGIIELLPNRGAVVKRVSRDEVREVCQVRRLLECEATRLACGRISLGELDILAADLDAWRPSAIRGLLIPKARDLDTRLHDPSPTRAAMVPSYELVASRPCSSLRDVAWGHDSAKNDYRRLYQSPANTGHR